MCGRYYIDIDNSEMKIIVNNINNIAFSSGIEYKTGEIFPTNMVPIITGDKDCVNVDLLTWGFPKWNSKGVIINARYETITEKPTFRKSFLERRCVIPSTGFYEWDNNKQKYIFNIPDQNMLYMAGIWNEFNGKKQFVIITRDANESMNDVHNRMPAILKEDMINDWINDISSSQHILEDSFKLERKIS